MILALPPRTEATPWPFIEVGDADHVRNIALSIDDALESDDEVVMERAGLIYFRTALLALADRIERDG